jgi:hypothetical protein
MWIASLLSGTCMAAQDTAATWVIEYTDSIAVVDISGVDIGVAAFLSAHAAPGPLADLVDRKKLLCVINLWLAAAATGLAIPGSLHLLNPYTDRRIQSKAERMHESERATGFDGFFSA